MIHMEIKKKYFSEISLKEDSQSAKITFLYFTYLTRHLLLNSLSLSSTSSRHRILQSIAEKID